MSDHGSLGATSSASTSDETKPVVAEWRNIPLAEWDTYQVGFMILCSCASVEETAVSHHHMYYLNI